MMMRLLLSLAAAGMVAAGIAGTAFAQPKYEFKLGFKLLALQIPDVVGQPTEDEHYGANGDSLQRTTTGLMVWRKADNWTAFTNGARTWINGPYGIAERANDERFPWEADDSDAASGPLQTSSTPRPKAVPLGESHRVAVRNKQIEITVLEVIRCADEQLRQLSPSSYDQLPSGPNDEKVLIHLRLAYVDGPPDSLYATDRVRDFGFLQQNGASGSVYLGVLPDPPIEFGVLSVGEYKEGWIAAIVDWDVNFLLVFGGGGDQKVNFALRREPGTQQSR